jgi:hypothetical protein
MSTDLVRRQRAHETYLLLCRFLAKTTLIFVSCFFHEVLGAYGASNAFNVAVLTNGVFAPDKQDIVSYLSNDNRVSSVSLIDATISLPSVNDLRTYNAVLYASDAIDHLRAIDDDLGNLLADYADGGGGVVLTSFTFGSNDNNVGLLGRIMSPGYSPYANRTGQGPMNFSVMSLTMSLVAHPAMTNVHSFAAALTNGALTLDTSAKLIAKYSNGDPLLAENSFGNVLGLNALVSPGTSRHEMFLTGDYQTLVVNSLRYAAKVNIVPEPSTAALLVIGCVVCLAVARRKPASQDRV